MEKNNNTIKIWIFHHDATPPNKKGMLRPYYLGKNINKYGNYDIKVFASSRYRNSKENIIKDKNLYKIDNSCEIPFIYVKSHDFEKNDINRIKNWISYYRNISKVSKQLVKNGEKPDIIIGSSPHPLVMVAAIKISRKLGIPCINEVRDFWPEVLFLGDKVSEKSLFGKIFLKGEKWIYEQSDSLIFLKEGDFNYVIDRKWDTYNGGKIDLDKINYINNGVELIDFDKKNEKYVLDDIDLNTNKFSCVYTGALGMVNNIDNILDTAKILYEKDKDIQILLYGDGDYRTHLEKRIREENINNIKIKGYVENKYIPYILSKSDLNILNYSTEKYNWSRGNSSNKLFEYMASGKPIISNVKMGYSILEKYKCGIELEQNTPEEFAEAILNIKNSSYNFIKNMGNNARSGAKDFDYKILSEKLHNVIVKTLEEKND